MPVPGDYDGDRKSDMAVFRPATGEWFVRGVSAGYANWGVLGDVPVPGDYDNNGTIDIAIFRPSSAEWYFRAVNPGHVVWGGAGDTPLPLSTAVRTLL